MRLIKPSEISARILTLLDESDERVIIVSPFMKISKWFKLVNKINGLIARNIQIEIYVRDDPENIVTYRDLDQLEIGYRRIPNLHTKLYMNEKYAIVTSMNLLISSEINSLEIGLATENRYEYNELLGYYYRYILPPAYARRKKPFLRSTADITTIHDMHPMAGSITSVDLKETEGRSANVNEASVQASDWTDSEGNLKVTAPADLKRVMFSIRKGLDQSRLNSWLWLSDNSLQITTGRNNYTVSIIDNNLRITAYLWMDATTNQRNIEFTSLIAKRTEDMTTMKVDLYPGDEPDLLLFSGQSPLKLNSFSINGLLECDAEYIISAVVKFVAVTYDLVYP